MKACLFDMDGLLINTEDMYTIATNHVLAKYNKGPLPWSVKVNLQGRPGPYAAKVLLDWAQIPLTPEELVKETSKEQAKLWPKTDFMPGAKELLQYLHENKIPIALATSSMYDKYLLKTKHLRDVFDLFGEHVVTGDDSRIPEGRGKPAPDIWLVALESLNKSRRVEGLPTLSPEDALVFEDGIPGVQSGLAAGCTVIWVPHPELAKLYGDEKMDEILPTEHGERLKTLKDVKLSKYNF